MAILPPLITVDDLVEYGYPVSAESHIARASARVRNYSPGRQKITAASSTVKFYIPGPYLLPQRPVRDVTSVLDSNSVALTEGEDWELHGQVLHVGVCAPITIAWDHGFVTLPDELIEAVCAITARLASTPAGAVQGARTEQAGGEMVVWGVEAFNAASELTPGEKAVIDRIYPRRPHTAILI